MAPLSAARAARVTWGNRRQATGFRGSSVVAPGSDDGSLSLTLPGQTVNRGDHGNSRAQFSCAVYLDTGQNLWRSQRPCGLWVARCILFVCWSCYLCLWGTVRTCNANVCVCVCVYLHIRCDRGAVAAQLHYPKKKKRSKWVSVLISQWLYFSLSIPKLIPFIITPYTLFILINETGRPSL